MVTRYLVVFLFFLALAALRTLPLVSRLGSHIPSGPLDPLLNTWILAWDVHALTTDPLNLFNANIFYPVKRSLAFSEHLLGILPIFAPVYLLTGNPVLGYNVVFFLSFAFSGFAMFALAYYWTRAFWPSLVAGTLFAFAPVRFAQISHLQLLNFFWTPLAVIFLDRFLLTRRWRDLGAFAGFYWLQILSSVYLGYMITIASAVYVGYYAVFVDRTLFRLAIVPKVLAFGAGSVVILFPLLFPYFQVSREWGVFAALDQHIHSDEYVYGSAEPLNYLSPPLFTAELYRRLLSFADRLAGSEEKWLFPGLILPALALLGSLSPPTSLAPERVRTLRRSMWLVLVSAFLLSLGPFLIMLGEKTSIPLPYLGLFQTIPGFRAVRVPARFALLAVLAAALLAGLGVLRLSETLERLTKAKARAGFMAALVAAVLIALALLELGLKPLPLTRISVGHGSPGVYGWLAAERPGPIVEIPFGLYEDYVYLYYSTRHWLPVVNGASGFTPPTYPEIKGALQSLPSESAVQYLKAIGVKMVVVHTDRLRPGELARWNTETGQTGLQKVQAFGPDILYRVPSGAMTFRPRLQISTPDWLPAAQRVTLGLSVRPDPGAAWRHPSPHELSPSTLSRALIEWRGVEAARIVAETRLRFPFVVLSTEPVVIPMSLETPRTPGTYVLRVSIPSLDAEAESRSVEIRESSYPTSLTAPSLLSASYSSSLGPSPLSVSGLDSMGLRLTAKNTGQAVWLAEAREDKGAVRLGWRWFRGNREMPASDGRISLAFDVLPEQSYEFKASIDPPGEPGAYTLEVGLVSERVAWFSDLGNPGVRLSVRVEPPFPCESFENLVASSRTSFADSPRLGLFTDRPVYRSGNDRIHLFVTLDNVKEALTTDAYLALRGEDCRLYFFEYDRDLVPPQGKAWPIFLRSAYLVSDLPLTRIKAFPRVGIPPGSYVMTLLLTQPNSYRTIAQANTAFQIGP